jgi:hypothetical protein
MNKISFKVPYNTNNILTQDVLFFSGNVIFDVFYLNGLSYLYEPLIVFLKKNRHINYLTFLRLLMILH